MSENKNPEQFSDNLVDRVKLLESFRAPPRPEPKPLGSICDDSDDSTNFLSTAALVIIFVLVVALLILAIITMSELLNVIRTVNLESGL